MPDTWLNYHHLLYFWMVAREGSITRASELLHLAQPTLSSQLRKLEQSIGAKLFDRSGRNLVLTETGQMVFSYADEIFTIGSELSDALRGQRPDRALRLTVGVPDVLPKLVVYRLLQPALELDEPVQLVLYEGKLPELLSALAVHRLDVVLADAPLTPAISVKAFNHLLGETTLTVFGTKQMAAQYRNNFPHSLHGAPMLLPTQNTTLRRAIELWFDEMNIRPFVKHEFEDSALLKVFGSAGQGLFCAPTAIAPEVGRQYGVLEVGRIEDVRERFYAISVERRLKHPAVVAISKAARDEFFSQTG
jgi:LysR family transcriptional activator of nhaA